MTTIAFVACIAGMEHMPEACLPFSRRIERYGSYVYDVPERPVGRAWCRDWAWAYVAVPEGVERPVGPVQASRQTMLGNDWNRGQGGLYALFGVPHVTILPDTIQCWPVYGSAT